MDAPILDSKLVEKALNLLRRKKWELLANHPIRGLTIIKQGLSNVAGQSLLNIGKRIGSLLEAQIEQLHPGTVENTVENTNEEAWRVYLILHNYYVKADTGQIAYGKVHLGKARFNQIRQLAIHIFTEQLKQAEQDANKRINSLDNREWSSYRNPYFRRTSRIDGDYLDVLQDEIESRRNWAIAVTGGPGIGKTKLVYEVGMRLIDDEKFRHVVALRLETCFSPSMSDDPYSAFLSLDDILNALGKELGRRDFSAKNTADKQQIIYEAIMNRHMLLILDDLEHLQRSDWRPFSNFLQKMPKDAFALVTSRERGFELVDVKEFQLGGMSRLDAIGFMRQTIELREIFPAPTDGELDVVYDLSVGGIPALMLAFLGLIKEGGLSAAEIKDIFKDEDHSGELPKSFINRLHEMLDRTYQQLKGRDPYAVRILHLMPTFRSPTSLSAIAAALGVKTSRVASSLSLLYSMFLVDRIKNGGDTNDRHNLVPYVRDLIRQIEQDHSPLPPDNQSVDEFLLVARRQLAVYYTEQLTPIIIGQQIKFLGPEKLTVLKLLEWCYSYKQWTYFIDLMDVVGRPLAILGEVEERRKWGIKAMEVCQSLGERYDERREWFAVHDVGWSLARLQGGEEAKRIWQDSLTFARQQGFKRVEALALRNLSQQMVDESPDPEDLNRAVDQLLLSIKLWKEIDDPEWLGHTLQVLGLIYHRQHALPVALQALHDAHENLNSQGHTDGIVSTLSDMSLVEFDLGHLEDAIRLSKRAIERASELSEPAPALGYALWRRAQLDELRHEPSDVVIKNARKAIEIYEASFASRWADEARKWLDAYIQRIS